MNKIRNEMIESLSHLYTQPFIFLLHEYDSPKEKWFIYFVYLPDHIYLFLVLKLICIKYGLLIQYHCVNKRSYLYFLVKEKKKDPKFAIYIITQLHKLNFSNVTYLFYLLGYAKVFQNNKKNYSFTCFCCCMGFL